MCPTVATMARRGRGDITVNVPGQGFTTPSPHAPMFRVPTVLRRVPSAGAAKRSSVARNGAFSTICNAYVHTNSATRLKQLPAAWPIAGQHCGPRTELDTQADLPCCCYCVVKDEINASNLRPYHSKVDAEQLQDDEYLADKLLDRRSYRGVTQYLVKWRGYPRDQSTWESRRELERRCSELVVKYDADHPAGRRASRPAPPAAAPPPPAAPAPAPVPTNDEHLPSVAQYERGRWMYGRTVTSPRGSRLRLLPSSNFTDDELASDHFVKLRADATAALPADARVASVINLVDDVISLIDDPNRESHVWFSTTRHTTAAGRYASEVRGKKYQIFEFYATAMHTANLSAGDGLAEAWLSFVCKVLASPARPL